MKKIVLLLLIFTFVINCSCFCVSYAINSMYVWSPTDSISSENSIDINSDSSSTSASSSNPELNNSNELLLESGGAILIEQSTGQVLYEHNSHEQLRPASVTKIMSILLIMEAIENGIVSLDDRVPCSSNARAMGGSQIWLAETEQLTVNEMLKAICIVSANDCTVAMAEYLYGSEENFVQKMNERAKQLGMNDTCFKNCHGIDEDGHVTSAYDISLMSRELLLNHPSITNYTTVWMDSLRDGKSQLVNTNKLLRNYEGCTGLKTGSTSLALYNLTASATRNGLSLIAVIMKAPSTDIRFKEAKKLLDYGFANFSYTQFAKSGDIVRPVIINKGLQSSINAVFSRDAGAITKKGQGSEITQTISLSDNFSAPITSGQKLGEATYSLNGTVLSTVDIVAETEVKKLSFANMSSSLYKYWFCLLRN